MLFVSSTTFAQDIKLKRGTSITYQDTTLTLQSDTIINPSDTSIIKIKKGFFTRQFNKYLVVSSQRKEQQALVPADTKDSHAWYIGKTIRSIRIKKLDVFGTDIRDTAYLVKSGIGDLGNRVHIKSQDVVIHKSLLFVKGDTISPALISESERLLRSLPFIKDSRIIVLPGKSNPELVDIIVVEKDIWSLGFDIRFPDVDQTEITLKEINLLGLGHKFSNQFHFTLNEPLTYRLKYSVENILGTFTRGELSFGSTPDFKEFKVDITRDFLSANIKYGGGLNYHDLDGFDVIYRLPDTMHIPLKIKTNNIWFGRSFNFSKVRKSSLNLIVSAGALRSSYSNIPTDIPGSRVLYQNNTLAIGSLTLLKRRFFKSNYLFGFGKTEDVPQGFRVEITGGYEHGDVTDRTYAGISLTQGHPVSKLGYFSSELNIGSFFNDGLREQSILQFSAFYFSKLLGRERPFRHRLLLGVNYTLGDTRRLNEAISIDDLSGLRGLKSDLLYGHNKLVCTFTHIIFTPWKPLGFQVALSPFCDLGIVGEQDERLFSNRIHTGFGLEMQLNNEDLVFGTIRLRAAFYPSPPSDSNTFRISGFSGDTRQFDALGGRPPAVFGYGM